VASGRKIRRTQWGVLCHPSRVTRHAAFTLIELVLVLALLVVITSLAAPAMARFIRGRALDSEARRLFALTHAAQSRAVSEGLPMLLWVDEKKGLYGLTAETSSANGDLKAETVTADPTLQLTVTSVGASATTTFNNFPAVRFLPDGTVDESSPQVVQLTDAVGISRWLVETMYRTGYEVTDTKP
jgi:type II secretion system protein H